MKRIFVFILAIGFSLILENQTKCVNNNSNNPRDRFVPENNQSASTFSPFTFPRNEEEIAQDEDLVRLISQFNQSISSRDIQEYLVPESPENSEGLAFDFNQLDPNFEPLFSNQTRTQLIGESRDEANANTFPNKKIEKEFKNIESNLKKLAEEENKIIKINDHLKRLKILINSLDSHPEEIVLTVDNIEEDYKKFKQKQSEIHASRNDIKQELIQLMAKSEDYKGNDGLYLNLVNKLRDVYRKLINRYESVNFE